MRLENGLVRFDFDDRTGSLRQIKDCRTGREYLTDPRGSRLVMRGQVQRMETSFAGLGYGLLGAVVLALKEID